MSRLYQKGPSNVPHTLTSPTQSFKKHVVLAIISLICFAAVYMTLMVWFSILSYDLFIDLFNGENDNKWVKILTASCLAFLSIFMFKSLFIFKKEQGYHGKEVTAESEPELFSYLNQLADEAGAPRPHRIFLSTRVNACVFYDLSLVNLIIPSKKNLEIGLGLINILSLGELKAVLAHEFGHFAQRSMLLGRYVYTAQQIAVRVINRRDALDNFISGLSGIDIRVAWIGWLLSILVWAVRSLIHVLFSVVAVAEKALSREMEFQADLVAVSLTGSDALINALYKLKVADEGYNEALRFMDNQLKNKKSVEDLFALQANYIEKMRWILNEPQYGLSPEIVLKDGSERVFTNGVANPPEMWSTHPSDNDREENAKKTYVYADIDQRSAWELFSNPETLKRELTHDLIGEVATDAKTMEVGEAIDLMNNLDYNWEFLNPKYKGAYLSRYSMLNFATIEAIYDVELGNDLKRTYQKIYTTELSDIIDQHQKVREEIIALEAIYQEVITAEKRVITHRGNRIKRKEIPEIIKVLKYEEEALRAKLILHDQQSRTVNLKASLGLEPTVAPYLKQLTTLVHYAEHSIANIQDTNKKLTHTIQVVTANGSVSSSQMLQLIEVCNEFHRNLKEVYGHRTIIQLDEVLVKKMGATYDIVLPEFRLGLADKHSMNTWVNDAEITKTTAIDALIKLRNAALEQLLKIESQVQIAYLSGEKLSLSSYPLEAPEKYQTLTAGKERELKLKIGIWDRFIIGDGLIPTVAKFAVAASIIGAALFFGLSTSKKELNIYNGLNTNIIVQINDEQLELRPFEKGYLEVVYGRSNEILTLTNTGDTIEQFSIDPKRGFVYAYNVASAGLAYEYTVSYGYNNNIDARYFGAIRIYAVQSDYILEDAPENLTSYGSTAQRTVFKIESQADPYSFIDFTDSEAETNQMVESHLLYDDEGSENLVNWLSLAAQRKGGKQSLFKRIEKYPFEVATWRQLQEISTGTESDSICTLMQQNVAANPDNADLHYLAIRCMNDGDEQDSLFLNANKKWPYNPWLAYASAYLQTRNEDWEAAYENYLVALDEEPQLYANSAIDFERIHKLMQYKGRSKATVDDFLKRSSQISYYRELEAGFIDRSQMDPFYTYYLISKNKLYEATDYSVIDAENEDYYSWFFAASTNAISSDVNLVLDYDTTKGISYSTIWMALALKMREGKPIDDFLLKLKSLYSLPEAEITATKNFLELAQRGQYKEAEAILKKTIYSFTFIANHYMMGVILKGAYVPYNWKLQVDRLLYISEKPYLGVLPKAQVEL